MITVNPSCIPSNLVKNLQEESFEGHQGVINYVDYQDSNHLDQTPSSPTPIEVPALKDQEALKKLFKDNGLVSLLPLGDSIMGEIAKRYLHVAKDNDGGKLITVFGSPNVTGFTDRIWLLAWSKIKPSDQLMTYIQQDFNNGFQQAKQLFSRLLGTGNQVLKNVFGLALTAQKNKQIGRLSDLH